MGKERVNDLLEEVRGIFYGPRSDAGWGRLQVVLDRASGPEAFAVVDYVDQHLETWRWPARLRVAHQRWLQNAAAGRDEPRLRIARIASIDFELDFEQLQNLLACEDLGALTSLDLRLRVVGDEGAALLARAPSMARLRRLDLGLCHIGERGAKALGESETLRGLRDLDLRHNMFGDRGLRALAGSPVLDTVETLNLNETEVSPRGLEDFLRASALPSLKSLSLADNALGSAGGEVLLASPTVRRLDRLCVESSSLTIRQCERLSQVLGRPVIRR